MSLEIVGQAIPGPHVEEFYRSLKVFEPFNGRRSNFIPISDLCKDHIHDFFNKWDIYGRGGSGERGNNWHFERILRGKLDTSVADIAKHLISCCLVCGFDVIEGIDVGGKHK